MQQKNILYVVIITLLILTFVKLVLADYPSFDATTLPDDNLTEDTAYSQDVNTVNGADYGSLVFSTLLINFSTNNLFSINPTSGLISFTPAGIDVDSGNDGANYSVLIIASDGNSSVNYHWHFIITAVNDTPQFNTTTQAYGDQTATEDTLFSLDISAWDEEDGGECAGSAASCNLIFSSNYSWFTIHPYNGSVNFTPTQDLLGAKADKTYYINITVNSTHDWLQNSTILNLTITYVNDKPQFNSTYASQSATEGTVFTLDINGSDEEDGGECAGDAASCPIDFASNYSWFTINANNGSIRFTPTNDQASQPSWRINVTINDSDGVTNSTYIVLSVAGINDRPYFTYLENMTGYTNVLFYFNINASDVDVGDVVNYTWNVTKFATATNIPALNVTDGVITFAPNSSHIGTHWINVTIRDANSTSNSTIINFTIYNDTAPIFSGVSFIATEGVLFYTNLTLNFSDAEGDSFNFFDNTSLFDIGRTNGSINFTAYNNTFIRTNWVNITVNDSKGAQASYIINFTVYNVNSQPKISAISAQTVAHNSSYTLQVIAVDNDTVSSAGETLHYYDNTTLFEINRTMGGINFTPTYDQVGFYYINVTVNDTSGSSQSVIFSINITNAPPSLAAIGAQRINTYHTLTLMINATDAESDTRFYYDNTSLFNVNISSGLLSFTPTSSQIASHWVNISVLDAAGGSDSEVVNISVYANVAPTCTSALSANYGASRSFTMNENETTGLFTISGCTDANSDNLTYYWYWAGSLNKTATPTDDNTQNTYSYFTTFLDAGDNNVTIIVSDGNLNYTYYWNATVNNTNSPISVIKDIANQTIVESTSLVFNLSEYFFDHDSEDVLNFSVYSYTLNETFPASTNTTETSTWGAQAGNWTIIEGICNQTATDRIALSFYTNYSFTDYSLVFKVKLNGEGSAGVCYQAQDTNCNSGYRVYLDSSSDLINFDIKNTGTASNLTTNSSTFDTGTWYWLKLVATSSTSQIFVSTDGSNYTKKLTVASANFTSGKIGLLTINTTAQFDNILLNESGTKNFTVTITSVNTTRQATLTPSIGFNTGVRNAVVTAQDGNGSFAKSNLFYITVLAGQVSVTTVTTGGGGGSTSIEKKIASLDLIVPSLIMLNASGELLVPIIIKNDGDLELNKVSFGASTTEKTIQLLLDKTGIDKLLPGQEQRALLRVKSDGSTEGRYSIDIETASEDPKLRRVVKLFVDITAAEGVLKVQLDDQVSFTRDLFLQNPECLELQELVDEAEKLGKEGKFDDALRLISEANEACKNLIRKKPIGVKFAKAAFTWENWKRITLELIVLSIMISGLMYYLRRIRFKKVRQ